MKKHNTLLTILLLSTLLIISPLLSTSIYASTVNNENCINRYYSNTTFYYNGNIITVDDNNPSVQGVLTGDGKIIGTGSIFSI